MTTALSIWLTIITVVLLTGAHAADCITPTSRKPNIKPSRYLGGEGDE
jgi:hypothetical protein